MFSGGKYWGNARKQDGFFSAGLVRALNKAILIVYAIFSLNYFP